MSPSKLFLLSTLHILILSQIFDISRCVIVPDICNASDKSVLLRIKSELGNPPSLASWNPRTDCCVGWSTVKCNNQGHVIAIGSVGFGLDMHGSIPPSFDDLRSLTYLYISDAPNLSGPIPSLGNLTNLTSLTITKTSITGPVPEFLAHLTNLETLVLSENGLTGPIPNFLGRLKKLHTLYLGFNKLTGPIPTVLSELPNLRHLHLGSNRLSGPIPDFLGHLPLVELVLSNNQFTGPIPYSFARVDFFLTDLSYNKLSGNASFLFHNRSSNDYKVYLQYNILSFDFTNVDVGKGLTSFNISHNMIYGSLPKASENSFFDAFDVSYNQLCGPIPNDFKGVNPAYFSHNKCLCGGPLPACK